MTIVFAGKVIATAQKLVYIKCGGAALSAAVTPSANRNSYRVAGSAYRPQRILLIYYHRMGVHKPAHHSVLRWQYNNGKTNKPQPVSTLSSWGELERGFPRSLTQAAATLTELRFPSPGLRA